MLNVPCFTELLFYSCAYVLFFSNFLRNGSQHPAIRGFEDYIIDGQIRDIICFAGMLYMLTVFKFSRHFTISSILGESFELLVSVATVPIKCLIIPVQIVSDQPMPTSVGE